MQTITPTGYAKGVIGDAAGSGLRAQEACSHGRPVWAYRYRTGGPGSRRLQRGGFSSERDAAEALERALEDLGAQNGVGSTLDAEGARRGPISPNTTLNRRPSTKLGWLLAKAVRPSAAAAFLSLARKRSRPGG